MACFDNRGLIFLASLSVEFFLKSLGIFLTKEINIKID